MRYDLYGNIHKALRRELAILVADLGTLDPNSDHAVADYVARFRGLAQLLRSHTEHEDAHLGPHLQRLVPQLFSEMEAEHVMLDAAVDALDHRAAELFAQPERRRVMHEMYLELTQFIGRYWLHLHREETAYQAAFHAAYSDAELAAIEGALVASIEPGERDRFMQMMSLAMNVEDQRDLARAIGGAA